MHLPFVQVDYPGYGRGKGTRWVKAKADLTADELVVSDRAGNELFRLSATQEVIEGNRTRTWKYGDVIVRDMPGACSCGGLRKEVMI